LIFDQPTPQIQQFKSCVQPFPPAFQIEKSNEFIENPITILETFQDALDVKISSFSHIREQQEYLDAIKGR